MCGIFTLSFFTAGAYNNIPKQFFSRRIKMKKILTSVFALSCAAAVFAGGIDNKSNLSTGYLRNPSRATETKRPEAVLYNIAGTSFMEDGLAFNIGNQFIFKEYTNECSGKEYKDDEDVFFFPDFEAVWKKDRLAIFAGFGVFAGGGSLDYKDGTGVTFLALAGNLAKAFTAQPPVGPGLDVQTATTKASQEASNHSLEAYSVTMGEMLGLSYNVTENISLSAAGRFLHSDSDMKLKFSSQVLSQANGGNTVEYDASGYGFGGIFGVNAKDLVPGLILSLQYQTITKMDIEFDSVTGKLAGGFGIKKGEKYKNDLPAVLTAGAGYNLLGCLDLSLTFNYYFNKQATMENPLGGSKLKYDDSWEVGLGCDWQINDKIGVSAGTMYSKQGFKSDVNSAFSPVLDSVVVGCGAEYKVAKQVMLTAAYLHCFYFDEEYKVSGQTLDLGKNIDMLSVGLTVKPF